MSPAPSRPAARAARPRRAQAMLEFGITAGLLLALWVTVIEIVPVFSVRATVFEVAMATVEAAAEYRAPWDDTITPAKHHDWLCRQLDRQALDLLKGAGLLPASTNPVQDCRATLSGAARYGVEVNLTAGPDGPPLADSAGSWSFGQPNVGLGASAEPKHLRACVHYRWKNDVGMFTLIPDGFGVASATFSHIDMTFCGRGTIDPRLSS